MFRDTLAAPSYNNTGEDQVHLIHRLLVFLGALSRQESKELLSYYPGAPLCGVDNIAKDLKEHYHNSYNVLG
jgi:hypothetical protein